MIVISRLELQHLDVSIDLLRKNYPLHYRRWVGWGVLVGALAYSSTTVSLFVESGARALRVTDPYAALAMVLGLVCWWLGHARIAALLAVVATLADILVSLVFRGIDVGPPTLAVAPLILAVGLWLGGRAAFFLAVVCAPALPACVWLGARLGWHRGLSVDSAVHQLVAAEAVLIVTVTLLLVFLDTFAQAVLSSQEAEKRERALQEQLLHAQKLEALGLLAGGIAHDFNNLLTAIAGYGSLLSSSSDPEARELAGGVMAAQERGTALIKPLLAFARQEIVEPKPLDLSSALADMVTILRRLLGERVKLELEANELCPIVADPGQIEQVVVNLVANARDAMPSGGKVCINCHAGQEVVVLKVQDSGEGMTEETKTRIFEPFFTTKERGKGTGLGLAMVHGLVTSSGGSVIVDSRPGEGATFTLTWPRTSLPVQDEVSQVESRSSSAQAKTVLMAEDNDSVRAIVKRVLERAGYEVLLARNAEEALDLVVNARHEPDLLLSDVIMPGMTGPELLARMRELLPNLRHLFMSGYLGEIADRYDFDPDVDLITKPFSPVELLERIDRRLNAQPPAGKGIPGD